MMENLEPCPFCGNKPRLKVDSGYIYHIECSNLACVCRDTRWFKTEEKAIKAWNTRKKIESIHAQDATKAQHLKEHPERYCVGDSMDY